MELRRWVKAPVLAGLVDSISHQGSRSEDMISDDDTGYVGVLIIFPATLQGPECLLSRRGPRA